MPKYVRIAFVRDLRLVLAKRQSEKRCGTFLNREQHGAALFLVSVCFSEASFVTCLEQGTVEEYKYAEGALS